MTAPYNKQFSEMTLEELREERAYWDEKITNAPGWGAAVGAADELRRSCDFWIIARRKPA